MYFWNLYPFVRLSIALIVGILCYDDFPILWEHPFATSCTGLLLYSGLIPLSNKYSYYKLRHLHGTIALLLVFFIGGYSNKINYHSLPDNHYKNLNERITGFSGTITSPVNERTNHFRYDFELSHIINSADSLIPVFGKIHLYIHKDSTSSPLIYGDHLNVYGRFFPVSGPGNPNEFDYRQYLERQNIFSHAFVKAEDVGFRKNTPANRILKWAYSLRSEAEQIIDSNISNPRENGIAKALLLGIKDHLDNDVKEAYSAAGAMHVLAVSGLHVGIIFLIIKLIFGKLKERGKWGKYTFGLISVLIIWLYATVTGLSPSVLRAATMFSLVAIGEASIREGNIYNSLGLAAFLLLLFDPYLIFSVGFQLSFAAVIGIVYLQPKLYHLFYFRIGIFDKAWAITCVSIAAQLATFPLTAYYFHQFPTYFLASNLIVIPAAFLMLTGGMAMLMVNFILPDAGKLIGQLLENFMWLVNEIISYVHILPNSLIEWIYMDQVGLILSYAIVFTFIAGLQYRAFKTLVVSGLLGFSFMIWTINSHEVQSLRNELVFYEIKDQLAIDYIQGHTSRLYVSNHSEKDAELLSFQIDPHRLSSHLNPIELDLVTLQQVGFTKKEGITQGIIANERFIIFDSTTFHLKFNEIITTDYIIIQNQAVKSLKWLKDNFMFDQVIIGSNNPYYYSEKMLSQAKELGISIHSMVADGALRVTLKKGIKKSGQFSPLCSPPIPTSIGKKLTTA